MARYTSFAIFGAGLVGMPIARALSTHGASVLIITRPGSARTATKHLPPGVAFSEVDFADRGAVMQLLSEHNVQVVISTISSAPIEAQNCVADAAQAAGVELFAPSEFGVVTDECGPRGARESTIEHLRSIRLPFARFYVGFFMELIPGLTGLCVNGKINLIGAGNTPCSFTASEDVAGFVAHVLTSLHRDELANRTFRLQGDRLTLAELGHLFKVELNYVEVVPGQMGELWTRMQAAAESGVASTGWDALQCREGDDPAGSTNYLWEGHQWRKVKDLYRL